MKYNPNISIEENAKKNKCSQAAIRKYIRVNGIDRRYESKVAIINAIRKVVAASPSMSYSEIADKLNFSITTIKKYYSFAIGDVELPKIDTNKVSKNSIRQLKDYYATHPSVTRDLLKVEKFGYKILEPCCGGGFMAEIIKQEGYDVDAYDIVDRGYGKQADFLTYDFEVGKRDVITNIPYYDVVPFLRRALEVCNKKVAILMPLRYLSSQERYLFFENCPPSRVYVYTNRVCIAKNGEFDKYEKGQNLEIYAWYIWDKDYKGETLLRWITNNENAD